MIGQHKSQHESGFDKMKIACEKDMLPVSTFQQALTQGVAIFGAFMIVLLMFMFITASMTINTEAVRGNKNYTKTIKSQYVAEAAIERAVYEFWHLPMTLIRASTAELEEDELVTFALYRKILDGDTDLSGELEEDEAPLVAPGEDGKYGEPKIIHGELASGSYTLQVRRRDLGQSIYFEVIAAGESTNSQRYLKQAFIVRGSSPWAYGMLTDKLSCVFCHFELYPLEAGYKPDNTLRNFFKDSLSDIAGLRKVRLGGISDMQASHVAQADSYIAGTVYTRGQSNFDAGDSQVYGSFLNESNRLQGGSDFHRSFAAFSHSELRRVSCRTRCSSGKSLYVDYPRRFELQVDGPLPASFPSPVPDRDGNRHIDDAEWDNHIANQGIDARVTIQQSVSPAQVLSRLDKAGIIAVESASGFESATSLLEIGSSDSTGALAGHSVIFRGTNDMPLHVKGKVYIDGDVVLSGRVTGDGMIVARGNIYIVGDVVYDCGKKCNYADMGELPTFAIASLKNILVGPYFNVFFTRDQIGNFNSSEEGRQAKDSTYIPRFYAMDGEDKVTDTQITMSLAPQQNWLRGVLGQASSQAAIEALWGTYMVTPWQSGDKTRGQMIRAQDGPGLRFDGLLYTPNAIMFMSHRSWPTSGAALINGSLISADVGILVPGWKIHHGHGQSRAQGGLDKEGMGLRIHHDPRLSHFIDDVGGGIQGFEALGSRFISRAEAEEAMR